MAFPFPLPPVPNFRVSVSEPGHVKLIWSDYTADIKVFHRLLGFRLYRSEVADKLGTLLANESILTPTTFQYDDTTPGAGPIQFYTLVGVERYGFGEAHFGSSQYGEADPGSWQLMPYNTRPFGSPRTGWGEAAYGTEGFGT